MILTTTAATNNTSSPRTPKFRIPTSGSFLVLVICSILAIFSYYFYNGHSSISFYAGVGILLTAVAVAVVVARVAVVAWITVLVLLAFAGNRRKVLAREGRNITAEVGRHVMKVLIGENAGGTILFAVVVSLLAMVGVN